MIFSVIFLEIFYGTIHKEPYYIKKSRLNSGIFLCKSDFRAQIRLYMSFCIISVIVFSSISAKRRCISRVGWFI